MSYGNKTRFYNIPFPKDGDIINEEQEALKMSIIDNLLYAATFGANKCLIEEGSYHYNNETKCLVIKPLDEFSLLGIINYRLFMSDKEISIPIVYNDAINYVYIKYNDILERNVEGFSVEVEPMVLYDSNSTFLLCQVDTRNNQVKIITDVNGKTLAKNVLAHTKDTTNPHGSILHQDTLNVKNLNVQGNKIYTSIYDDIISQGKTGVDYNVPSNFIPIFVNAYGDSLSVGNISWEIKNNNIIIYNSGDFGKTIHLKIEGYYK